MATTRSPLATAAAMAGGSIPGWNPHVAQNPADPMTTDFKSAGLPSGWTHWNPGSATTYACTEADRLVVAQDSHVGAALGGVVRSAPTYDAFVATAILHARGRNQNYGAYGIIMGGADMVSAPTTARLVVLHNTLKRTGDVPLAHPGVECDVNNYQRYNLFDGAHASFEARSFRLLRIAYTSAVSGNLHFLASEDGLEWQRIWAMDLGDANLGGSGEAPAFMGVFANNEAGASADPLAVTCSLFRIDETDDMFIPCGAFLG